MAHSRPCMASSQLLRNLVYFSTAILCSILSVDSVQSANTVKNPGVPSGQARGEAGSTENIWKAYTPNEGASAPSCADEYSCLAGKLGDSERLALEAIRTLHGQLDDDANGNIDLSESDEFLREELHYEGGHERRQKAFHRDDDMHISVRELWDIWIRSEVHNWTTEQTTEWLANFVQLPQYVSHFQVHGINGTKLPRLAVNNIQYMSGVLGIKDPIHRQKITVKAMDVVLFGSPKDVSSPYKDLTLITLLVAAVAGAWYTYRINSHSKQHLNKLMKHMEILSTAEKELQDLQVKLQHAREEQDITLSEKMQLERKLEQEVKGSNNSLYNADPLAELELRRLREEVDILRSELQRAEGELEDRLCWSPPPELQHWLQLTYELEQRVYNKKRLQAEKQLEQAKDACEKLNRKRSSFVASFVSTHGRTIDDVDKSILEARSSLMEVKQDLQERTTRWRQIETLCGFPIVTNPGLNYLETLLRSSLGSSSRYMVMNSLARQGTLDEDGDETSSLVSSCAGNGLSSHSISLSELPRTSTTIATTQRQKLTQRENSKDSAFDGSTVSSVTGGEELDGAAGSSQHRPSVVVQPAASLSPPVKTESATPSPGSTHKLIPEANRMTSLATTHVADVGRKSPLLAGKLNPRLSHPVKAPSQESQDSTSTFKSSQSESALDVVFQLAQQQQQNSEAESVHEENLSTDSSLPSVDDEARKLKKKQRFHFPSFVKRNKNKT